MQGETGRAALCQKRIFESANFIFEQRMAQMPSLNPAWREADQQ
jgi:hypothetical protein